MPAQATTPRNHIRRFTRSLLLGVAGSAMATAAAHAQACPSGSSGGTVTISTSCPAITLSNNTSLEVTSSGSTTSIIGDGIVGNITVNGSVTSTGTAALNRGTATSIGTVRLGAGSKVSATAVFAVDYRSLRTLASFTNDGELSSSSSGFGTRNTTINGNIINNDGFARFRSQHWNRCQRRRAQQWGDKDDEHVQYRRKRDDIDPCEGHWQCR